MKIKFNLLTLITFCAIFAMACNSDKQTDNGDKTTATGNNKETEKQAVENGNLVIQDPDFADPAIRQYFSSYNAYLKKVVTAIRSKDEAGTMKIFREEGKQWDNKNEMEQKARSTPEEETKFTAWLLQSHPFQAEIVKSEYHKKYMDEYYKKVKEDFDKKNN